MPICFNTGIDILICILRAYCRGYSAAGMWIYVLVRGVAVRVLLLR